MEVVAREENRQYWSMILDLSAIYRILMWPSDVIWRHGSLPTLFQAMAGDVPLIHIYYIYKYIYIYIHWFKLLNFIWRFEIDKNSALFHIIGWHRTGDITLPLYQKLANSLRCFFFIITQSKASWPRVVPRITKNAVNLYEYILVSFIMNHGVYVLISSLLLTTDASTYHS